MDHGKWYLVFLSSSCDFVLLQKSVFQFQVDDDIVQVAALVGGFSRDNVIAISCSK